MAARRGMLPDDVDVDQLFSTYEAVLRNVADRLAPPIVTFATRVNYVYSYKRLNSFTEAYNFVYIIVRHVFVFSKNNLIIVQTQITTK